MATRNAQGLRIPEGVYTGEVLEDDSLFGTHRVAEQGASFVGGCENGVVPHGCGEARYLDKTVYTGRWFKGVRHGGGKITFANGSELRGNWVHGRLQGHVVHRLNDGTEYDGEFENGRRNGYGVLRWSNGYVYSGEWKNGRRHGRGKLECPNGTVYDGMWIDDKQHGSGEVTVPTTTEQNGASKTYVGAWKSGRPNGYGTLTEADGTKFEGNFQNGTVEGDVQITGSPERLEKSFYGSYEKGRKSGRGRLQLQDGSSYCGEFRNGVPHGYGELERAHRLQGSDRLGDLDGVFRGNFEAGFMTGWGQLLVADGRKYVGDWRSGQPNGSGNLSWTDGKNLECNFDDGVANGEGVLRFPGGARLCGMWECGRLSVTESCTFIPQKGSIVRGRFVGALCRDGCPSSVSDVRIVSRDERETSLAMSRSPNPGEILSNSVTYYSSPPRGTKRSPSPIRRFSQTRFRSPHPRDSLGTSIAATVMAAKAKSRSILSEEGPLRLEDLSGF